jgi:Secretion system C-terminal sorting domain
LLFVEDEDYAPGARVDNAMAKSADQFSVSVFPNPFTLDARVEVVSPEPASVKYIVSDLSGNVLEEKTAENRDSIQLGGSLPRGLYLLKIISGDWSVTQRLVKR